MRLLNRTAGRLSRHRRGPLAGLVVLLLGLLVSGALYTALAPAQAVLKLDVTQGNVQPIPIAIPDFIGPPGQDPALGRNVGQIVAANLRRSGLFAPIDPAAHIERLSGIVEGRE